MGGKYGQHRPTYWDRIVILANAGTLGGCSVAGPLRVHKRKYPQRADVVAFPLKCAFIYEYTP
jgi:hypothetical protein